MFINDKIIFLQLDKTASTHISRLLHSVSPGESREKHSQLEEGAGGRCVVGSVRNPWDWYVSLWAYGCRSKGKIYKHLTQPLPRISYRLVKKSARFPSRWPDTAREVISHSQKDRAYWRRLYASADDPALFREWLRGILAGPGRNLLMGQYPHLPLREFAGFLSYRFLSLFVDVQAWRQNAHRIRSQAEMDLLYRQNCIVDRYIRMEHLEHDLLSILNDLYIDVDISIISSKPKTNVSERHDSKFYYNDETVELVRERDQLIVSEFKYTPPELA